MNINIVWGKGHGPTKKTAYDSALKKTGIHNYNLISLSSIVPPNTNVIKSGSIDQEWETGTIVSVVQARNTSSNVGEKISAGLSWKKTNGNNGGIFLEEHCDNDKNKCKKKLYAGMNKMIKNRPEWNWKDNVNYKIIDANVEGPYTTVLVLAIFGPFNMEYN